MDTHVGGRLFCKAPAFKKKRKEKKKERERERERERRKMVDRYFLKAPTLSHPLGRPTKGFSLLLFFIS